MPTGTATTYDLNTGIYLDLEDLIHLLSATDVPLQNGYDGTGLSTLSYDNCFEKKVEWTDEELLTPRSELAAAVLAADTAFTTPSGEALRFGVGDVLAVNDEYVRVTAVDYSTDTLTVTRGYAGSTAADQAAGDTLVGVGKALPEGSDPEVARAVDRTARHNLTQIFGPEAVKVSGSEQAVKKYGVRTTEFDHQVGNRMKEAAIAFEQALLYGGRYNDASNEIRTMGGFSYFIQTNVDSSTTSLTPTTLADQIQACFDAGGSPDWIDVGMTQKRVISGFDDSIVRYIAGDAGSKGRGQVVDYIDSDAGRMWVGLNRWIRSSDLFLRARDQAQVNTLRPMVFEMLAKTGDSVHGQVLSERTLKFYRERHAARFTALT